METTTCSMCNHVHDKTDGTCSCGCTASMAKTCSMCNHVHDKMDGSCSCGCKA